MANRGMNRSGRGGGFTFVDLMAVMVIVAALAGVAFSKGGLVHARDTANRVACASHLRQLFVAAMMYSNENKGTYPRTVFKRDDAVTQYTGVACKDPFGKDGAPKNNDVTAAMFLLLRTQEISPEVFICPGTDATPLKFEGKETALDFSNFRSEENLSYSMAVPYPSSDAMANGYRWNATLTEKFAMMADMNPGDVGDYDVTPTKGPKDENAEPELMRKANSMNHRGTGQNVVYGDGHVEFATNPFVGMNRDNIYTVSGGDGGAKTTSKTIAGLPAWAGDSVLLPVATRSPHKLTEAQSEAAAAAEFRRRAPQFKEMIAAEEGKGNSAKVEKMKKQLAEMEAEAAEIEGRAGKGK